MKKLFIFILLSVVSFGLVGCQNVNNSDVGTIAGGVIGGLVGSRFGRGSGRVAAAAAGTLVGAYIGSRIGDTMDRVDRQEMSSALEKAPTGRSVAWTNPDTGNHYRVTPKRTYYRKHQGQSQPCREFTTTASIGGKQEEVYGRACRQADGSWKIIR